MEENIQRMSAAGSVIPDVDGEDSFILVQEKDHKEVRGLWNLAMGELEGNEEFVRGGKVRRAWLEMGQETGLIGKVKHAIVKHSLNKFGRQITIYVFESNIIGGRIIVPDDLMDVQLLPFQKIVEMERENKLVGPYVLESIQAFRSGELYPLNYFD